MGENRSEALFKAVGKNNIEFVKVRLNDLSQTERDNLLKVQKKECGSTVLHYVAGKCSPDMMQYMVESVSEDSMYSLLNIQSWEGNAPIHWAAVYGRTDTMKCIMATVPYASVCKLLMVQNVKGYTPLHRVANFGRVKTIQCIVEFLENHDLINALMIQCNTGNTAAHIAVGCGYTNILECILKPMPLEKAYNFLKLQNEEGHTAVQFAAHRACPEILKNTLDCIKKSISSDDLLELLMIQCKQGQHTVVHLMAFTDEIEMMRCLLDPLTPDQRLQILNSKNVNKLTPWDVANQCGMDAMMSCIERYQTHESDTLHDNEDTVEEPRYKIARLEASLSNETKRREEAEQQLIEIKEKLTQIIANFTSQKTTLENSLEEAEQQIVVDVERTVTEQEHKIAGLEARLFEEITKRQETEQQLVKVTEELTQKTTDLASRNTTVENSLVEERHKREEAEKQVVEDTEEKRKLENQLGRLRGQVQEVRLVVNRGELPEGINVVVPSTPEIGCDSPTHTERDTVPQLAAEQTSD